MEVVILGSSSATPTLRRGLSSVALLREGETLLFDCGEGTQFQMLHASIPRRKFHHIFITHLHGDHIFGLPGLISSLNLNQREYPLHLYGPRGLQRYVEFVTNFPRPTRLGFELVFHELRPGHEGLVLENDEYEVYCAPLDHTVPAMGYRLQEHDRPGRFDADLADRLGVPFGPERGKLLRGESIALPDGSVVHPEDLVGPARHGRTFVYCTDTASCRNARLLAQDADVLIHEATYADQDLEMARDRKHSTIRQAATIARDAGARRFVATHFSTRYDGPSIRILEEEGREVFPDLIMARDLLRVAIPHVDAEESDDPE